MHDLDARDVHAEHLVRKLGERRLHALPVRVQADANLQATAGGDAHRRLVVARNHWKAPRREHARAVRRLLAVAREAKADDAAVGFTALLALAPLRYVELLRRHAQRAR